MYRKKYNLKKNDLLFLSRNDLGYHNRKRIIKGGMTKTRDDMKLFTEIENVLYKSLEEFFTKHGIKNDHNHIHALEIAKHALKACLSDPSLTPDQVRWILLAAFLHDVDDDKLREETKTGENENLRKLLTSTKYESDIKVVEELVGLVSSSKNGDRMDGREEWMFIPRYSDRLDAIGMMGVARTFAYTVGKKKPLYCYDTPRPTNLDEIYAVATEERYRAYKGKSRSMIDHCFDKLIRLGNYPIKNKYLVDLSKSLSQDVLDLVLVFGNQGKISVDDVQNFIKLRSPEVYFMMEIYKY